MKYFLKRLFDIIKRFWFSFFVILIICLWPLKLKYQYLFSKISGETNTAFYFLTCMSLFIFPILQGIMLAVRFNDFNYERAKKVKLLSFFRFLKEELLEGFFIMLLRPFMDIISIIKHIFNRNKFEYDKTIEIFFINYEPFIDLAMYIIVLLIAIPGLLECISYIAK